ncbi:MAG TPA: hypothetical protein VF459_16605 [Caulobacteraceae bacterium]
MSDVTPLRLVEEDDLAEAPPLEQKVFVRPFSVVAGAPWDQARAAGLEARLGAPLPLAEVVYQLQRLDPWRPGRPARFAAFYVRSRDVGEALEATLQVDGRRRQVRFVSAREQARKARGVVSLALGLGLALAATLGSIAVALSVRADAEGRLANLAPALAAKMKLAKTLDRERKQSQALEIAGLRGRALSDYLSDLAWASAAKAPGSRIDALHWDHGLMAVEAHGDAAPFVAGERQISKIDKPLRPGVWLWGVSSAGHRGPARGATP